MIKSLLSQLRSVLGGAAKTPREEQGFVSVYVRCARCGSIVRVRVRTSSDVSRDDDGGLFVRKTATDVRCYSRMEIDLKFDDAYRVIERSVLGGEWSTREQWMAQQSNLK